MKIEKIEFKNVFAYGNTLNTVNYTDTGKLVLLKGKSGTGKSAILNLPGLLLYGKVNKIPKASVANRINKKGVIRGTITKNGHVYEIERGFAPNTLRVLKDGVDLQSTGKKDAQDYIDSEIIDMPYHTFSNTIAISMKAFKSFLTMSSADRKNIVDRIFSMEIINMVFEKIKADAKEIGNNINADSASVHSLTVSLQATTAELERLKLSAASDEDKAKIESNMLAISEHQEKMKKLGDAYRKLQEKQTDLDNRLNEIRRSAFAADSEIQAVNEKISLFRQDRCPTCGASFHTDTHDTIRRKLGDLLAEKQQAKARIETEAADAESNRAKILEYLNKIVAECNGIQAAVNSLAVENSAIEATIKANSQFEGIESIIRQTSSQIEDIKSNMSLNTKKLADLQNLMLVYSVDGVKQQVINNYLPVINKEIADHLLMLNFPYSLSFDSKFEPTLSDLGAEIDIATLSDGEQTRIDLVCLCSLLKMLKMKYSSLNIFSLDETISTLDSETGEMVIKFLKDFALELKINIFIVSHVEVESECFDEQIEVVRKGGFSEISKADVNM